MLHAKTKALLLKFFSGLETFTKNFQFLPNYKNLDGSKEVETIFLKTFITITITP